jgi:hypothetical protein
MGGVATGNTLGMPTIDGLLPRFVTGFTSASAFAIHKLPFLPIEGAQPPPKAAFSACLVLARASPTGKSATGTALRCSTGACGQRESPLQRVPTAERNQSKEFQMSTLQTLMALVVLIYVLSVIVQAVQEVVKSLLNTKAKTMEATITKFMGEHLTLDQVNGALQQRGLDITALEHVNKDDFRHLLDGIRFTEQQIQRIPNVVALQNATVDQLKDHAASAYEAARGAFQKAYTKKNKIFVIAISFIVVIVLNANLIMLYEEVGADQVMAQAIVGKAEKTDPGKCNPNNKNSDLQSDLAKTYSANRDCVKTALKAYPVLVRWSKEKWSEDWDESKVGTIFGLLVMGVLVSLGAPFWNDVLKGVTGVNNTLNTNDEKTS